MSSSLQIYLIKIWLHFMKFGYKKISRSWPVDSFFFYEIYNKKEIFYGLMEQ